MNILKPLRDGVTGIAQVLGFMPTSRVKQLLKRRHEAALVNRLTQDWITSSTSADADVRTDLVAVRSRARDLVQNDPYARRLVNLNRINVPGPTGFHLQVRSYDIVRSTDAAGKTISEKVFDEYANHQIETAFADWATRRHCTVTGTMTLRQVEHMVTRHMVTDGEFLIRKIRRKSDKYLFTLQMLEPDLLNVNHNERLPNGNIIRMGIELDQWRRPVAYHLLTIDPTLEVYGSGVQQTGATTRVPAEEIYHGFAPDRAFQTRGISPMAPSMMRLRMLSGYEMASLVNARASAAKMGFLKNAQGEVQILEGDETDTDGNMIQNTEPGSVEYIGDMDFTPYDPKYPDAQHEPFTKGQLRGIASGWGVSYTTLANDLEGVNYSSIRAGLLDERDHWRDLQQSIIEQLLDPLFEDWLDSYLSTTLTNLPITKFSKFNAAEWIGRTWTWVDPLKEVTGFLLMVQAGFTTARRVAAEQGRDLRELYQEMAEDKKMADEFGLQLKVNELDQIVDAVNNGTDTDQDEQAARDLLTLAKTLLTKKNGHHTFKGETP
jgi:lambda family phage portal protein